MKVYPGCSEIQEGNLSATELAGLVKLFARVWPKSGFTYEYLEWLYVNNPLGLAYTCNVVKDGRILAHYAAIPVQAELFGSKEMGLLSLNTVVDPEYRGLGYFKKLALNVYGKAKINNYGFVVGVANSNSTLLFQKLLHFQLVGPLCVKIGFGQLNIANRHESDFHYKSFWDERTLFWRLAKPNTKYYLKINSDLTRDILLDTYRFGIHVIAKDLSINIAHPKKYFRWNPVNIWVGLDAGLNWEGNMYCNFPAFLKPSPLNFIFKDLSGANRELSIEKIKFSFLDFDAF